MLFSLMLKCFILNVGLVLLKRLVDVDAVVVPVFNELLVFGNYFDHIAIPNHPNDNIKIVFSNLLYNDNGEKEGYIRERNTKNTFV